MELQPQMLRQKKKKLKQHMKRKYTSNKHIQEKNLPGMKQTPPPLTELEGKT